MSIIDPELQLDRIASQINQTSTSARSLARSRENKLKNFNIYNSVSATRILHSGHHQEKMQGVRIKPTTNMENITDSMFRQNLESAIPTKPSRENTATAKVVLPKEKKERMILKHINFSTGNKPISGKNADTEKGPKAPKHGQALKGCLKTASVSSPSEQGDLLVDQIYRDSLSLSAKNGMGLLSPSSDWGASEGNDFYDAASHSRSYSNLNVNSRIRGDFSVIPKGEQHFNTSFSNIKPCNKAAASSVSSTTNSDDLRSLSNSNSTSAPGSHTRNLNSHSKSCDYNFYPRRRSRSPNSCITTSSGGIEDNQSQSPFHTSDSLTSSPSPVDTYHPPIYRPAKCGCKSRYCNSCYPTDSVSHNNFRSRAELVTMPRNGGNNCLHAAVEENNLEQVWSLVNNNFDVMQTNRNGETPGDLAAKKGNDNLQMILELAEKLQERTKISDEKERELFNVNYKYENLKRKHHSVLNENAQLKLVIAQQRSENQEMKPKAANLESTHSQMGNERFHRMHVHATSQPAAKPEEFLTQNSNRGNYPSNRMGYSHKRESQGKEMSVDEGYPPSGELLIYGAEQEQDGFRKVLSTSDSRRAPKTMEDMSTSYGIYNL